MSDFLYLVCYSDHHHHHRRRRQHHCHGQFRVNDIIIVFVIALIKPKPTKTKEQMKP